MRRPIAGPSDSRALRMDLTPMVDVTFLLLIFLLGAVRFQALESKLESRLPRDIGIHCGWPVERLDVRMDVVRGEGGEAAGGAADPGRRIVYTVGGRRLDELGEVDASMARFHAADPTIELRIDPRDGVVHQEVVDVLDLAKALQFRRVLFAAHPGE